MHPSPPHAPLLLRHAYLVSGGAISPCNPQTPTARSAGLVPPASHADPHACISPAVHPLPRADAGTLRSATAWRLASICASSPWTFAFTSAKSRSISDWLPETIASDHCIIHHVSTRTRRRRRRRHRLGSRWRGCPLDVGTRGRGSGRITWHPPERALLYISWSASAAM